MMVWCCTLEKDYDETRKSKCKSGGMAASNSQLLPPGKTCHAPFFWVKMDDDNIQI